MKTVFASILAAAFVAVACPAFAQSAKSPGQADQAVRKIDTVAGSGATAEPGSVVTVHYTGWLYAPKALKQHGAQFDSSVRGTPFTFKLGAGKVIPGWDQGLVGMRVGGKRTLIIPAAQGYGARGAGPIPPHANLIFDVELLQVQGRPRP